MLLFSKCPDELVHETGYCSLVSLLFCVCIVWPIWCLRFHRSHTLSSSNFKKAAVDSAASPDNAE